MLANMESERLPACTTEMAINLGLDKRMVDQDDFSPRYLFTKRGYGVVHVGLFSLVLILSGCMQPLLSSLEQENYAINDIKGSVFIHKTIFKNGEGNVLHVYIEGDGRPWWRRDQVALDPTPRKPVMLEMMSRDQSSVLYVGRPCYFGVKDERCAAEWWTHKRYGEEVIDSINSIINKYAADFHAIRLFGYSGGGTIATLLAFRRVDVVTLITMAANLDTKRWTIYHGYSPLLGSLSPADINFRNKTVNHMHFVGSEDEQVPASINSELVEQKWGENLVVKEGFDHSCCWVQLWPKVLRSLTQ